MPVPILDAQTQFYDFKGLNIDKPSDQIDEAELSTATNVLFREGNIHKRPGMNLCMEFPYNEIPSPGEFGKLILLGIHRGRYNQFYFLDTARNSIYASVDGINLSRVTSTFDCNHILSNLFSAKNAVNEGPYIIMRNAFLTFTLYQLKGFFEAEAVPVVIESVGSYGSKLVEHFDRLWMSQNDYVEYSNPGDFTTLGSFPNENYIQLPDRIWDIIPLDDKILVLTTDNLYTITVSGAPRNWSLQRIYTFKKSLDPFMTGAEMMEDTPVYACNKNFVELDNAIYVLAAEGLFKTNGVEMIKLSDAVNPYFTDNSNFTRTNLNVSIFNYRHKELIITIPGSVQNDVNNQIRYLIFNTLTGAWSKLELTNTTPMDAPIFDALEIWDKLEGMPHYTYDVVGFFPLFDTVYADGSDYAGIVAAEEMVKDMQGVYCMTNLVSNEPNKLFCFKDREELWSYKDETEWFESVIETKTMDYGYRGMNKKCLKEFLTLETRTEVSFTLTHKVNRSVELSRTFDLTPATRMLKVGGPGYFQEYSLRLSDGINEPDEGTGDWSLQTFAMDIMNKAEQLQSNGQ